jgi:hypothetical protein
MRCAAVRKTKLFRWRAGTQSILNMPLWGCLKASKSWIEALGKNISAELVVKIFNSFSLVLITGSTAMTSES